MVCFIQVRVVAARHPVHAVDLHLRRDPALLPAPQPGRLARTRDLLLGCTPHCPRRASVSYCVHNVHLCSISDWQGLRCRLGICVIAVVYCTLLTACYRIAPAGRPLCMYLSMLSVVRCSFSRDATGGRPRHKHIMFNELCMYICTVENEVWYLWWKKLLYTYYCLKSWIMLFLY